MRTVWALAVWALTTLGAGAENLRMAVTTSFENSGLSEVLLPAIAEDIGIEVQVIVVGTGHALRMARSGDVDAVLVHAKAAEEALVAEGHATHRREIMYNDFVLIGPGDDPAGMRDQATLDAALTALLAGNAAFVSRGDDSGTHKAEEALWAGVGATPERFGDWYRSVGQGMGATLNTTVAMQGYTLSDRASWLNFRNKGRHGIVFEGDPRLFNPYGFLPVSAARHPHVKAAAVAALEAWLTGPRAETLINGYRLEGTQLFQFNAKTP